MFCNAKLLAIDSVKPGEILDKNFLLPAKPLVNIQSHKAQIFAIILHLPYKLCALYSSTPP